MVRAVNRAIETILQKNKRAILIGEDVAFGGVFRCSTDLSKNFGSERVINAPLSEQGIIGFSIGLCGLGYKVIAEIQFADYIYPAFDQIVNEAAKYRYRSGGSFNMGTLIVRAPCAAVGHGGLYHSQSPESLFTHIAGINVLCPSTPTVAENLLVQCSEKNDPTIFLEPKRLYRVSKYDFEIEAANVTLGRANVIRNGKDITLIGWGAQTSINFKASEILFERLGIDTEVIDLSSLIPLDMETILVSVRKTGRLLIAHEAPLTSGFGAEIAASVQRDSLMHLKSPILRICGYDTPFPLSFEQFYLPGLSRIIQMAIKSMKF